MQNEISEIRGALKLFKYLGLQSEDFSRPGSSRQYRHRCSNIDPVITLSLSRYCCLGASDILALNYPLQLVTRESLVFKQSFLDEF